MVNLNKVSSEGHPAGNYMFKVSNRKTRTRCEICSKLTIKIPEWGHLRRCGVFIVDFEHISHLVLVFLLLFLSRYMPAEETQVHYTGESELRFYARSYLVRSMSEVSHGADVLQEYQH